MRSLKRRNSRRSRANKLDYQIVEPRKLLAAIFPTYIDGELTLGDPNGASPYPLADTFKLQTNPGASKTIYLDFNGHYSVNNSWDHSINFPAWSRDGSSSFSSAELIEIQKQFQNVAEDFAPFDVNVTTENPGNPALIKSSLFDQTYGVRVVNTQATGGFGSGIGGIAYVNSFDDSIDNPVFVFNKGVNNGAMTISHEVGHALGLYHDGLDTRSYHPGSGSGETSWGPILGAPFNRNVTQWSNGDYAGATETQDDLAIITNSRNGINYKADDAGDTIASASLLETEGDQVFDWGFVERNTDVDFYEFSTSGGLVDIDIKAFEENPNLDVRIRLYDINGNLVLANNPTSGVDALIERNLAAGKYYLAIDGVGKVGEYSDYGSLGFYSIEGTIPAVSANKIGEVGNIPDLYHAWKTVQLSKSYVNPVVIAGPSTTNGGDPVTVRIRNITSNSFEIRIDEWEYRDDLHSFERVDYMVVEAGTHQLADGTTLRAGKINQSHRWVPRTFGGAFENSAEPPVVVASVTSKRENTAVTTRLRNITTTGFEIKLQEEQAADQIHASEQVNWIAIEKGSASTGSSDFIVAETGRAVSHRSHTINFSFPQRPSLFAEMQSFNGGDNATVRTRNLINSRAVIFLEEEKSADSEINHTTENVGYFVIPQGDIVGAAASSIATPTTARASDLLGDNASIEGDQTQALREMESWGELYFDYAHVHGNHRHSHVQSSPAEGNGHGCGCGCGVCIAAQQEPAGSSDEQTLADFSEIPFNEFQSPFSTTGQRNFRQLQMNITSDSNRFPENIRQRQVDGFFNSNLTLLENWFRT